MSFPGSLKPFLPEGDKFVVLARNIAPDFLNYVGLMSRAFTRAITNQDISLDDIMPLPGMDCEALCVTLHLVDRIVFGLVGATVRSQFMNPLLSQIDRIKDPEYERDDEIRQMYNSRQADYAKFTKIISDKGEAFTGTLCWEFGKLLSCKYSSYNPVSVTIIYVVLNESYTHLRGILSDESYGLKPKIAPGPSF